MKETTMVAVLVVFPLLMIATLVYVGLAAHDETVVGATSEGQTGCVSCASKRASAESFSTSELANERDQSELIAA